MALLLHIIIALSSLVFTTYLYLKPSQRHFKISYGLVGATIATGSYLIILNPTTLTHVCMAGIAYISIVVTVIILAHRKQFRLTQ